MTIGGLLYHFQHDPIPLEITFPYIVFTFVDDSEEKLSMETFMVLFIFLFVGLVTGLIALLAELWVYKKNVAKRRMRRQQRIAS